ncbi:MAG TPA: hypothetical protein VLB00_00155 [Gemmatimonadales bacterium]|nr:hypothetical protein [Gemmatimonadales bacterium]
MTDFPDDIYAPTSRAQPPVEIDLDQVETLEAEPTAGLSRMSQRLGDRLRSTRQQTPGRILRLMT